MVALIVKELQRSRYKNAECIKLMKHCKTWPCAVSLQPFLYLDGYLV